MSHLIPNLGSDLHHNPLDSDGTLLIKRRNLQSQSSGSQPDRHLHLQPKSTDLIPTAVAADRQDRPPATPTRGGGTKTASSVGGPCKNLHLHRDEKATAFMLAAVLRKNLSFPCLFFCVSLNEGVAHGRSRMIKPEALPVKASVFMHSRGWSLPLIS